MVQENVEEGDSLMKAFILILFSISLYGFTIDEAIDSAMKNNLSLKTLEQQVQNKNYDIKNSEVYKNPMLSIGLNDILLKEPTARDLEPMQTNYVAISQEIINGDKIKYKKQIESINKQILETILKEKQAKIKQNIYKLYFTYDFLTKQIKILDDKLQNIKQINIYHNNHIEDKKAFSMVLRNQLKIDMLILKQTQLKEQKIQILATLEELINKRVLDIVPTTYSVSDSAKNIETHNLLQIEALKIKSELAKKDLSEAKKSANITLYGGYYHREEFDDYLNFGVKIPLKIYDKEENDFQKSLEQITIAKTQQDRLKLQLEKEYQIALSKKDVAKSSIEITKKLIVNILKEKELLISQNSKDTLLKSLMFDNEILDSELLLQKYQKEFFVQSVMLDYLNSRL